MRDHVRILAVLHIVFGALGLLAALAILAIFGGIAGIVGFTHDPEAHVAIPVLGLIGAAVFVLLLVLSLPGIIAGVGLLKFQPWARILTIILCALNLMNVPVGTALGIYGLWVLLQEETERLFATAGRA
jgi:hypothetical protein